MAEPLVTSEPSEQNNAVSIRTRSDGATELRVNGVFVMDDVHTDSEKLLADLVLQAAAAGVLVGGLGLGYTLRALLDGHVTRVVVAELHQQIVEAMQTGLIPGADLLRDQRVSVVIGDVQDVAAAQPDRSLDAILLDVDNGPDALVYRENATLYRDEFFTVCASKLRSHGQLSVWSMAMSHPLRAGLARHFQTVTATPVPVTLQGRAEQYWLLTADRPL